MPAVEVMILGKKYEFDTAEHPERVRAAGHLLDRRIKTVSETYGVISNERVLVLAALNLAEELIRHKQDTRMDRVEDFLRGLADRLEVAAREETETEEVGAST